MMNENELKNQSTKSKISQLLMAIPIALIAFSLIIAAAFIWYRTVYANQVVPGVYVMNIDLTGKTLDEAKTLLDDAFNYSSNGIIVFTFQDQTWEATPADLGYWIDSSASAEQAFAIGRGKFMPKNLVEKARAWFTGVQVMPVAHYDERAAFAFLQTIATEIDQPEIEASLGLVQTEVVVIDGQVGREVDMAATLATITPHLVLMEDAIIPLVVEESHPAILDVAPQAELARKILSKPLVLTAPKIEDKEDNEDNGDIKENSWSIEPENLASMLTIHRIENSGNDTYEIGLNEDLTQMYLNSLAPGLYVAPVNARFIFNDDTLQLDLLESAVIGRSLDIPESIEQIKTSVLGGIHEIPLAFTTIKPSVTNESTGEELGVTELVHQEISYFFGSDPSRVQNIKAASSRFHGLLIAPWETFSMADALGNISLDNGYAEAPIIFGDQTIQGIGGGICQVSTTLFRAAFFAGLPINERHAHAYRVGYYEQRSNGARDVSLAGLDATVYVPIVDLKFTNDTDHWLLMETYMGNYSLTWKFYSTDDGRTVEWNSTGPQNIVKAPEDLYRENPELPKGTIKQVDYSADGADVTVNRTVYFGDQVHFSDSFFTRFQPWQAVFEFGPGTEGIPTADSD